MPKLDFAEAVDLLTSQDSRYDREAYIFLRDALDHTVKLGKKARETQVDRHVTGQQLLEGIRHYALKMYGPMVVTVFEYWGICNCQDFGEMVYGLIDVGVFGRRDTDSIDDFKGGYSFKEAFVDPFLPERRPVHRRVRIGRPARELN